MLYFYHAIEVKLFLFMAILATFTEETQPDHDMYITWITEPHRNHDCILYCSLKSLEWSNKLNLLRNHNYVFGADLEYESPIQGSHDHNAPCAVCAVSTPEMALMIPAAQPPGQGSPMDTSMAWPWQNNWPLWPGLSVVMVADSIQIVGMD